MHQHGSLCARRLLQLADMNAEHACRCCRQPQPHLQRATRCNAAVHGDRGHAPPGAELLGHCVGGGDDVGAKGAQHGGAVPLLKGQQVQRQHHLACRAGRKEEGLHAEGAESEQWTQALTARPSCKRSSAPQQTSSQPLAGLTGREAPRHAPLLLCAVSCRQRVQRPDAHAGAAAAAGQQLRGGRQRVRHDHAQLAACQHLQRLGPGLAVLRLTQREAAVQGAPCRAVLAFAARAAASCRSGQPGRQRAHLGRRLLLRRLQRFQLGTLLLHLRVQAGQRCGVDAAATAGRRRRCRFKAGRLSLQHL